jgi:hypothetical protein
MLDCGAMLGGWAILRYSLKKTIWPFLLAQNLTNIVYMLLALQLTDYLALNTGADSPTPIGSLNLFLVAAVHGFDQLAGGLGTSVLTTFLMRTCLPAFKAAHFAIGTGPMNISGVFSQGAVSHGMGRIRVFFGINLASIPGLCLIFCAFPGALLERWSLSLSTFKTTLLHVHMTTQVSCNLSFRACPETRFLVDSLTQNGGLL